MRVTPSLPQEILGRPVDAFCVLGGAVECVRTSGSVSPSTDPALTHILPFSRFSFILLLDIRKKENVLNTC